MSFVCIIAIPRLDALDEGGLNSINALVSKARDLEVRAHLNRLGGKAHCNILLERLNKKNKKKTGLGVSHIANILLETPNNSYKVSALVHFLYKSDWKSTLENGKKK